MARRRLFILAAAAAAAAVVVDAVPVMSASATSERTRADGPLTAYSASVPAGAGARVQVVATGSGGSVVTLHVRGLAPNTGYGAHAHVRACGATGAVAGPHYQDQPAPAGHTADVAFANPDNEIWLDLTTNSHGNGVAQTVVSWQFRPDGANSVVVHAQHTATGPDGSAGTAGSRLACLSVDF